MNVRQRIQRITGQTRFTSGAATKNSRNLREQMERNASATGRKSGS